ncbi:MAG: hypothetical protein NT027_15660 [Proteobacteria bacterium]|nr:hypothetical protein [Pseudomonadota bacterium]
MTPITNNPILFYEPWGLGDAIIAATVAIHAGKTQKVLLACNSKWHLLLKETFKDELVPLISVDSNYTSRNSPTTVDLDLKTLRALDPSVILSARGDPRDYREIRRIWPGIKVKMNGKLPFLARQIKIIDLFYSMDLTSVKNRYQSWATVSNVNYQLLEERFFTLSKLASSKKKIAIHIGAQWKSRQYPFVSDLRKLLSECGFEITLIAGPHDGLPIGIHEIDVVRCINKDLVQKFQDANLIIVNDSSPLHLASALGRQTLCAARVSNIAEWRPPGCTSICSPIMPKGHWVDKKVYCSDDILDGWPSADLVCQEAGRILQK